MATATVDTRAIVLSMPPEILGPGSKYEEGRLALKKEYDQIILQAKKVTVVDSPESLEQANNFGRLLQAGTKDCEAFYGPVKKQIDAIKKPVLEHEKTFAAELDAEKRRLGGLITGYMQEQERKRQEEERKAREEAERQAREEALARAVELEEMGETEAAEHVLEEPIIAVPVAIQNEAPLRMTGQVGKKTYACEVFDVKALMKAVLEGKAPAQCFTLDQGWLNKKAGLDKEGFNLPGCRLKTTQSTHFRS